LRFKSEEDQHLWHECSRLITNCIIFYNMTLLSQLWARQEATQDTAHIAHISPVAWQHMNFYGWYEFTNVSELINIEEIVEALAHHPILSLTDEGDA
jgi:Tn3 transposase DDE domain